MTTATEKYLADTTCAILLAEEEEILKIYKRYHEKLFQEELEPEAFIDIMKELYLEWEEVESISGTSHLLIERTLCVFDMLLYVDDGKINISKEVIEGLETDYTQSIVIQAISSIAIADVITYPFKKYFMKEPKILFEELRKREPVLSDEEFLIQTSLETQLFPLNFREGYTTVNADYDLDIITDYFTEEQRLSARIRNSTETPLDYWKSPQNIIPIKEVLDAKEDVNSYALREALYDSKLECTSFKVTLARDVMQILEAKKVLDFSAGWGDRLIGALSLGIEYTGYDPNKALEKGHKEIISTLAPDAKVKINYEPFEKSNLKYETFDLIFTSPPYFDYEVYTNTPGQSIRSYPKFNEWLEKFLFTSLCKAWKHLEIDGYLALHLNDVSGIKMTEITNLFVQCLPGAHYEGVIAARESDTGKHRPTWVWRKSRKNESAEAKQEIKEYYKQYSHLI